MGTLPSHLLWSHRNASDLAAEATAFRKKGFLLLLAACEQLVQVVHILLVVQLRAARVPVGWKNFRHLSRDPVFFHQGLT